jgi:hypothetical protein
VIVCDDSSPCWHGAANGLPGNLDRLSHTDWVLRENPELVFAMAHSPFADAVPPETRVLRPLTIVPLTAGWLARQADAGRVPEPDGTDPARDLTAASLLVMVQETGRADQGGCPQLAGPLNLRLSSGDEMRFAGTISVRATDGTHEGWPTSFMSKDGSVVRAQAGPTDVVVHPARGQAARLRPPEAAAR